MEFKITAEQHFDAKWNEVFKKRLFQLLLEASKSSGLSDQDILSGGGWLNHRHSSPFPLLPRGLQLYNAHADGLPLCPDNCTVGKAGLKIIANELCSTEKVDMCFYLLDHFFRSSDQDERGFAMSAVSRLPFSIRYFFHELESKMRANSDEFFHYLSLLLRCDQFELVNFLTAHILASTPFGETKRIEVFSPDTWHKFLVRLGPRSHVKENQLLFLYAAILDKLSIRPLLSFLNNFDMLPAKVQDALRRTLYLSFKKRSKFSSLFEDKDSLLPLFISNTELLGKAKLMEILSKRRSLLESTFGNVEVEILLNQSEGESYLD